MVGMCSCCLEEEANWIAAVVVVGMCDAFEVSARMVLLRLRYCCCCCAGSSDLLLGMVVPVTAVAVAAAVLIDAEGSSSIVAVGSISDDAAARKLSAKIVALKRLLLSLIMIPSSVSLRPSSSTSIPAASPSS